MRHQSSTVDGLGQVCPGCDTHIGLRVNCRMGRLTDFANSIPKAIKASEEQLVTY
jgi:hypothetical protein